MRVQRIRRAMMPARTVTLSCSAGGAGRPGNGCPLSPAVPEAGSRPDPSGAVEFVLVPSKPSNVRRG
jgi:hypothetical protein